MPAQVWFGEKCRQMQANLNGQQRGNAKLKAERRANRTLSGRTQEEDWKLQLRATRQRCEKRPVEKFDTKSKFPSPALGRSKPGKSTKRLGQTNRGKNGDTQKGARRHTANFTKRNIASTAGGDWALKSSARRMLRAPSGSRRLQRDPGSGRPFCGQEASCQFHSPEQVARTHIEPVSAI
uniref:Uncharacterized protein n=1 Tax=Toxoplasma gondii COUG TaxID=1074873 RepID=A0A2G8XLE3_TOXGO|nr:hypothetical protein TGCOUG_263830 [Toxoplasma gondii COUG]